MLQVVFKQNLINQPSELCSPNTLTRHDNKEMRAKQMKIGRNDDGIELSGHWHNNIDKRSERTKEIGNFDMLQMDK